jgi:hypothetical protein
LNGNLNLHDEAMRALIANVIFVHVRYTDGKVRQDQRRASAASRADQIDLGLLVVRRRPRAPNGGSVQAINRPFPLTLEAGLDRGRLSE